VKLHGVSSVVNGFKYCVVFGGSRLGEPKRFAGLTGNQLAQTIIDQGMHRVLSIQRDDPGHDEIRYIEGQEIISIWRRVYKIIQKRKRTARPSIRRS
jgi:hypothetical protein